MALRWKKDAPIRGLARIGAGPRGSTLCDAGQKFAAVAALRNHHSLRGWYWVAGWNSGIPHMNTGSEPCPDEATAKAEAMKYVKAERAKLAAPTTKDEHGD